MNALKMAEFTIEEQDAPERYRANPLVGGTDADLELHFNELFSNTFRLFRCTRPHTA